MSKTKQRDYLVRTGPEIQGEVHAAILFFYFKFYI